MIFPDADKLENWGNRYALVAIAAKRAKQIKGGDAPLIETKSKNPLTIALEEIAAGKITCKIPDVDETRSRILEAEPVELFALPIELEDEEEKTIGDVDTDEAKVVDESEEDLEEWEEEEDEEEEILPLLDVESEEEEITEISPSDEINNELSKEVVAPQKRGRNKSIIDDVVEDDIKDVIENVSTSEIDIISFDDIDEESEPEDDEGEWEQ